MKIKSLVSLFLTLTILGTRVGYALNIHYCKDKIAKISLAYNSSNCNMESNFGPKAHSENEFTKKSCCEDDIQLFQNHEPQKIDQENFLKITIYSIKSRFFIKVRGLTDKVLFSQTKNGMFLIRGFL